MDFILAYGQVGRNLDLHPLQYGPEWTNTVCLYNAYFTLARGQVGRNLNVYRLSQAKLYNMDQYCFLVQYGYYIGIWASWLKSECV